MYQSLETVLFRTPYFSYSVLQDFEKKKQEPVFKEMLQIATSDLSESLANGEERVHHSAYRYYQRACIRSTPFGLFAGCSMGTIGGRTEIQFSESKTYKRFTRLDMNYICALTQLIEKDKNIREQLRFFPNRSMYCVGNHIRYVEYHYQKTRRVHRITQTKNSEYLKKVLDRVEEGARFSDLVSVLEDDEITADAAAEFLHELIDSQVLISDLEPAVTGVQPLKALIEKLNGLPGVVCQLTDVLFEIETQLNAIDQQTIGTTNDIYPLIIRHIEKTKVDSEIKYLFQTDMYKPVLHATVSQEIVNDIQKALIFLNKITPFVVRTNLAQFKESFSRRYSEREMPMLFVLDNELGIGYAGNSSGDISPLVDDLALPRISSPPNAVQTSVQSILMQRYKQSFQKVVELSDEDVKGVEAVWDDLPPTFSVICQILQDDVNGRSVFIQSAGGHSATNLLGRFCHLDEQILNHSRTITRIEAQIEPDVILAEIAHLPESRIGNILLRPILRPYEIPYLSKSGVSIEFELRPDDLFVSVKNNRIVLRSKRLNKEIIPKMSTAHNYSGQNSLPVYHFLCDLQHQNGRSSFGFFWNEVAQQMAYLPRVVYKNCILSQARWTVLEKETKTFSTIKDDSVLLQRVKEWKKGRSIPDTVLLADGDNELYIDMNNPLSIRAWLTAVKKRSSFHLEEFLFNPGTAVVHGPEGVFTNEFVFAFYRKTK